MIKKFLYQGIVIFFYLSIIFAQEAGNNIQFYATGGGSAVSVSSTSTLKTLTALTLEAWIKPTAGGEWALIMGKQNNSSDANPWYSYRLYKNSDNSSDDTWPDQVVFSIAPGDGGNQVAVVSNSNIGNNIWTHIACVYDGSSMKIYINGQLDATYAYSGGIHESDLPFYMGHAPWTNYNNFNGYMDELRVWNVARTKEEIQDYLHRTLLGTEDGLIAYWPFNDDPSSSSTVDASTYSHTGTLSGYAVIVDNSQVPVGSAGTIVDSTLQTGIGDSDAQMMVTITSTPSATDYLGIYQYGTATNPPVTGESFPDGVDKRNDVVWGIAERGSVTADIILEYGAMPGISDESELKVLKRSNSEGVWTDVTNDFTQNTVNNTFSISGVTSFSEFAIGAPSDIPLPIELTGFEAMITPSKINLAWHTETETDNARFLIYRNENVIASIEGSGTTTEPHDYEYIDDHIISGETYTYVLADISYANNETKHTHTSVTITVPEYDISQMFELSANYPNPFNPNTTISYQLSADSDVDLSIYDITGKKIKTMIKEYQQAGYHTINWNASDFSSGVYLYRLITNDFVETKKMVLMK